jgi:hypothetical protein
MSRWPFLLALALTAIAASAAGPDAKYRSPRTKNGQGNYSLANTLSAVRKEEEARKRP